MTETGENPDCVAIAWTAGSYAYAHTATLFAAFAKSRFLMETSTASYKLALRPTRYSSTVV